MRISHSIILFAFIFVGCKSTDDFFRSYLDYELELPTDTLGNQVIKSNRIYGFVLNKNNASHEYSGNDTIINFNFRINTEFKYLKEGASLHINKNIDKDSDDVLVDDLSLTNYKTTTSTNDVEITFNRYFTASMTTNTTTSTIAKPGILKLKIVE